MAPDIDDKGVDAFGGFFVSCCCSSSGGGGGGGGEVFAVSFFNLFIYQLLLSQSLEQSSFNF